MHPPPQVVPMFEAKSQGEGHIEESWGRDDECADTHTVVSVIKCALERGELLGIGRFHQRLPHEWERCVIRHLTQVEEVGQVCPREVGDSLALRMLSYLSLLLLVLSHI